MEMKTAKRAAWLLEELDNVKKIQNRIHNNPFGFYTIEPIPITADLRDGIRDYIRSYIEDLEAKLKAL